MDIFDGTPQQLRDKAFRLTVMASEADVNVPQSLTTGTWQASLATALYELARVREAKPKVHSEIPAFINDWARFSGYTGAMLTDGTIVLEPPPGAEDCPICAGRRR